MEIKVNMKDFKEKWKYYSDNVKYAEAISINKGKFTTLDVRPYVELLTEFGINFSCDYSA